MKTRIKKVYMTIPGIQDRKALAWIPAYKEWDPKYKIRAGFGMNFSDYNKFNEPIWEYTYQGKRYWIKRDKGIEVAVRTGMNPALPETIPLEEWNCEVIPEKRASQYVYDKARDVYVLRGTIPDPEPEVKQPEKKREAQISIF